MLNNNFKFYLHDRLEKLPPSYFAVLMATGILSIACHLLKFDEISDAISVLNLSLAPFVILAFLFKIFFYPKKMIQDATNHQVAHGYFTIIAALGILGTQLARLHGRADISIYIWWIAFFLWIFLNYFIFSGLTIQENKPTLDKGINGGWLLAVVSTQSICVLGCILGANFFINRDVTLFLLLSFWLFGGMLYLWIIGLIFYRYMFFIFSPKDLMPPYWINMGAVAISTLAGVLLAKEIGNSSFQILHPFIIGLTLIYWSTATWWIPMLVILGVWRHIVHKIPVSYDPLYWGLVFPFAMYSVCTFQLISLLNISFLTWFSRLAFMIAISAWLLTFLGMFSRILFLPFWMKIHLKNDKRRSNI